MLVKIRKQSTLIGFFTLLSITFIIFINPVLLHASTAEEIEILLSSGTITYAQASRFILEAANALVTRNSDEAFIHAVRNNWLPGNISSIGSARLDHISLLLMGSFNISGGIMYSFFRNSHYAYRELVYLNIIQGRVDPMMLVSGERLLFYVNRILEYQESAARQREN